MNSLEAKRHTLAHLLAGAVLKRYPNAKATIGPVIENGFYYDFDFAGGEKPGQEELVDIESTMREILPSWSEMTGTEISEKDARERFKGNSFKLELIDEIAKKGEPITLYTSGDFTDLCRGGHSKNPSRDIDEKSFMLDRVAGAYWRGDEKKPMLTRIYGLAFDTKKDLDAFLEKREEAKKRDHRKIGKELDLFTFSSLVGPGLPLWTPKGALLRHQLDSYVWELRDKHGYQRVTIPHITKKDLYETSGHWQKFADELFRITTREGKEYALKPMNCPHHTQIFARRPHSYKEMPARYAETTMVYRDEQSGELGGLTRVLSITQDDSHVFCRHTQVKDEFFRIWDIIDTFYGTFGFKLRVRLSFHNPEAQEKYLGTPEIWKEAEDALRDIAKERNADYFEAIGEAAMYGPKLDFMATDSLGREHQVATIQLDMNMPERFDLTCINEHGEKERIVMIHCAVMGSIERFIAIMLEHTGGTLPVWLAPVQVRVLPISETHAEYAEKVSSALSDVKVRTEIDSSNESLGKKIRNAKIAKIPYVLVIGDKESTENTVSVESRDNGKLGAMDVSDFVQKVAEEARKRA
ncbi:Threonyl-tRNA synthetase [hydrothermal vent metagenome]|uniref:threonine--tRNA ligase n=1 Tax=hydrothermal vent metagenome TaxID=652676 RepID=A0A3B0ULJ2_9ZZZZ